MKKPIYYAVVRYIYGSRHTIVAVTSENKSYYFGRDAETDRSTRGKVRNILCRVPTIEAARQIISAVSAEQQNHSHEIRKTQEKLDQLLRAKSDAVAAMFKAWEEKHKDT